jgi:hypothetical protein
VGAQARAKCGRRIRVLEVDDYGARATESRVLDGVDPVRQAVDQESGHAERHRVDKGPNRIVSHQ